MVSVPLPQRNRSKSKDKHMRPTYTYKLLCSKGNHWQNKKTTDSLGENICKRCSLKGLSFRNKYRNSSYSKTEQPNKKGADLNRHFSKEHMKTANGSMIRYSTLLIIREMQIRRTMRHHLMQVRMAIIKYSTNNKCWRGCGEKEDHRTLLVGK